MPGATVARLPLYLRALAALAEGGADTVSSDVLAAAAGVTSAQVRKDLSHLGTYGTRGVGYPVDHLTATISSELGLSERRAVVIVGVGNLGHALAGYGGFASRGFRIAGLVDDDPRREGEVVGGVVVRPLADLEELVAAQGVPGVTRVPAGPSGVIGVIATPAAAAQGVCDRLVAAGVTAILNFAPLVLAVPPDVDVRKVDLSVELQILSFHEQRKGARAGSVPAPAALS